MHCRPTTLLLLALAAAWGPASAAAAEGGAAPSFLNDVIPVLTRMGCNQGACHGKNSGQNGFRLSLRGYAPEWDYDWLTRDMLGRRVNKAVPAESLLLQKPLGRVPHEGGVLFGEGSPAHRVLLGWVTAGAPGPDAAEPKLATLRVLPGDQTLKAGATAQLTVQAAYSDGSVRDVTWLTKFAANDGSVAEVDEHGTVKILRPGETAVRAHFQGQVAVAIMTAPYEREVPASLYAQRNNFIDDHVFAKLQALRIEPAGLCRDEYFLRRAYVDAIGCLPTPEEVRAFLADTRPDKRQRVIDSLLGRPEFVDYWTLKFADLLQNRKESDHDVRGTAGVRALHQWLREQVAADRPWDELARDVLTVTGGTAGNPAVGYYIVTVGEKRNAHESDVVAGVAQTFLGTRIGCAKCHNHPLEKYTQDDYYHFAGYFSRIKLRRQSPDKGATELTVSADNPQENSRPVGVVQPRTGQLLPPQPLDRSATPVRPGDDPRRVLAAWVTDPANEHFSGAMVNRLWAHFFRVGLVEPVDDLRASNPPSNPALWRALNEEFVRSKFDVKHMIQLILNSRAYQLSPETNEGNSRDHRFYSHYYARRLEAEVLLDALCQSTGVPEQFPGYPLGLRAVQVPDPSIKSYFLTTFGQPERITACACERSGDVTLPQVLHLRGADSTLARVNDGRGRLQQLLRAGRPPDAVVEELYLATFSRPPRAEEREVIARHLQGGGDLGEVFWALLNSKEFLFNH